MQTAMTTGTRVLFVFLLGWGGVIGLHAQEAVPGEALDPATYGPSFVESMDDAVVRDRLAPTPINDKVRQPDEHGVWMVPTLAATRSPHSGVHNAVNKWGDTRMGIGFPGAADVQGAYFAGQAASGAWTPAVRAIGYFHGEQVGETAWFDQLGSEPQWFAMNLHKIDRLEIVSQPVLNGGGWYGLDDLTYTLLPDGQQTEPQASVVDFEDLPYGYKLTGSAYRGLTWEAGGGDFVADESVHGPRVPLEYKKDAGTDREPVEPSGTRATGPEMLNSFRGVKKGDAGSQSYPPDTCGAIGPNHYVETVNRNFAVYNRITGAQLTNILLGAFLPGSNGDPRVLFDQYSGRWFVIVTDFDASARIYLAVSLTDDPMGAWFKTSFVTAAGSDAGKWPDYPTLGVDANGLYTAAYMVGTPSSMTIFALNKAPLIASPPSLGTITAFRSLSWEGAIQPAHTFGTATGEYLASWNSSTRLRVRRINPPLTAPTLTEVGTVTVPSFSDPPDAPALGSSTPLDTVDKRLMMALYRNGSLWTCHTISVSGRAGCRWYQLNAAAHTLTQSGTVADTTRYYFFPSLMVTQAGHVVMAFTGSSASQYASCYFTGRLASDPAGEMAAPVQYKAGVAAQNNIDGYGRNRWGDYSYTTLDPVDRTTVWTIQEYGHQTNIWGTWIANFRFSFPDCNGNGVDDACDLSCGTADGPCDVPGCGGSLDCDNNGIPDECDGARPGDLNCDGVIDFSDIDPFVLALTGQAEYQAAYPSCRWLNADCNADCAVTFDDIDAFVALLSGG
jgi:hypothetical protein